MVPFTITKMACEHAKTVLHTGWHCSQIVSNDLFYGEIKMLPSKLLQCASCIILILLPAIIHLMEAGYCVNNGYQNNN